MQKCRVQLSNEAYSVECASDCDGKWMECALTFLQRNDIPLSRFYNEILNALSLGKYRNIFIYGPANIGNAFIILPLRLIFKTFTNSATGTFAWMGVVNAEVALLNDFRWHPFIIAGAISYTFWKATQLISQLTKPFAANKLNL